jgi:hypothetical protein
MPFLFEHVVEPAFEWEQVQHSAFILLTQCHSSETKIVSQLVSQEQSQI